MFANNPALVLNADFQPLSYFPLSLFNWEDAVRAVVKGTPRRRGRVRSGSCAARRPTMRLPSVIALRDYVRPPARVAFTRFNVFLRDHFKCQYCGDKHRASDLTFDHVVPRSRRRRDLLGEHRRGMLAVQHEEGQADRQAAAGAVRADRAPAARGLEAVPAQLHARDLARLSLLGCRAGGVSDFPLAQWSRARSSEGRGRPFKSGRGNHYGEFGRNGLPAVSKTVAPLRMGVQFLSSPPAFAGSARQGLSRGCDAPPCRRVGSVGTHSCG